jgi:hypothetical protein
MLCLCFIVLHVSLSSQTSYHSSYFSLFSVCLCNPLLSEYLVRFSVPGFGVCILEVMGWVYCKEMLGFHCDC